MIHAIEGFVIGVIVGGIGVNLLSNYLYEQPIARLRARWNARRDRQTASGFYDQDAARNDGLFRVNSWNAERLLTKDRLRVDVSPDRPDWHWGDETLWRHHLDKTSKQIAGACGYPTGCSDVDFAESPMNMRFRVTLSPVDYAEGAATSRMLEEDPATRQAIAEALRSDPVGFVGTAPPMPLAINVAILNRASQFLAVQRSATVWSARLRWTVGISETLTLSDSSSPGHKGEDFFELARRGLREEAGLEPSDYGPISLSWFGYYAPTAHPWFFAQVLTSLPASDVEERIRQCHSTEEIAGWEWLPLTRKTLRRLTQGTTLREEHAIRDAEDSQRLWLIYSRLAITELWKMRSYLFDHAPTGRSR